MLTKDSRRWRGLHGLHRSATPAISATIAVVIWAGAHVSGPRRRRGRGHAIRPRGSRGDRGRRVDERSDQPRQLRAGRNSAARGSSGRDDRRVRARSGLAGDGHDPRPRRHHRPDSTRVLGVEEGHGSADSGDRRLSIELLATASGNGAGAQLLVGRPHPVVRARPRAEIPRRRTPSAGSPADVRLHPAASPRWTKRSRRSWPASASSSSVAHDDHYKARLPVGALEAIAAMPEVEWVGVSPPEQKLSLGADRPSRSSTRRRAASTPRRRSRSSSTCSRETTTGASAGELEAVGAAIGEYDADAPVLSRGGHAVRSSTRSPPSTSCCSSSRSG